MLSSEFEAIFAPLKGNAQLKRYLLTELEQGKLAHAYIFEGAKGSGKFTIATMLSAALAPEFSQKILNGECVDVNVFGLTDDRRSIGISTVRELKYRASIQPQELHCTIFIIRDAHTLTTEAQNSLLKILEEPPQDTYFFLLCETASALLPTVRSRAPILRMQRFDENELESIILSKEKKATALKERSPEEFTLLLKSSDGAVGNALARLSGRSDSRSALREKATELIGLLRDGKRTDVLLFFTTANLSRDELSTLLGYLSEAARDLLAVKKCSDVDLVFYLTRESADEDSFSFATQSLLKIYEECVRLTEALNSNVNQSIFAIQCANAFTDAL